jgi:hypothetical protein
MTKISSFSLWIIANAIGLCVGFWAILQVAMLIEFGQLTWVEGVGEGIDAYLARLASVIVGGAILGYAQSRVLKAYSVSAVRWVLATAMGFAVITVVEWPLMYIGMWGNIPGPVEPIILLVGGGSLAGLAQFFHLRRRNIDATKWLGLWIVGLIVSIVPTGLVFMLLQGPLAVSLSWPVEVGLNGLLVGGIAALVSGNALLGCLTKVSQ